MNEEIKRLFFGIEVHAPWPLRLPKGRLLDESHRHLTLAFLGNIPFAPLLKLLESFPKIPMRIGSTGFFDACLTLPSRHPHVVAWQARWREGPTKCLEVHDIVTKWLKSHHYAIDERKWLPHATLCREPFDPEKWKLAFKPLPFYTSHIHLYESVGNLTYNPIWSFPVLDPFEEIEHTADMAFIVRGETLLELYHHAFAALAFKAPELLDYFLTGPVASLVDIIVLLNAIICQADAAVGCPMKAVSFHGEILVEADSLLQWEMIVDV